MVWDGWGGGGGWGGWGLPVSFALMLEQSITKHPLNSVLEILKIDTLVTVFSLESNHFHCVTKTSTPFPRQTLKILHSVRTLDLYNAAANIFTFHKHRCSDYRLYVILYIQNVNSKLLRQSTKMFNK